MLRPSWINTPVPSRMRVVAPALALGGLLARSAASSAQASPTGSTPQGRITAAVSAMAALDSYAFTLDVDNGSINLIPKVFTVNHLDGQVVRPAAFKASGKLELLFIDIRLDIVTIGNDTWITNPLVLTGSDNKMVRLGDIDINSKFNPALAVNPDFIALPLLGIIENVELVSEGEISQYSGEITADAINSLGGAFADATIAGLIPGDLDPLQVDVFIDSDDLVHELRITGQLFRGEDSDIERDFQFSQFNGDFTIDRP